MADASTGYAPGGFDVWIDPIIRSAWNQSKILNYSWAANLYNISTPSNRPAGCVAVAMAQVMRYHTYPAGIALGATSNYYELNNAGDPTDTNIIWANYIGTYTNSSACTSHYQYAFGSGQHIHSNRSRDGTVVQHRGIGIRRRPLGQYGLRHQSVGRNCTRRLYPR